MAVRSVFDADLDYRFHCEESLLMCVIYDVYSYYLLLWLITRLIHLLYTHLHVRFNLLRLEQIFYCHLKTGGKYGTDKSK